MMRVITLSILIFVTANLIAQKSNSDLYVFVGEKIDIKEFQLEINNGLIPMDQGFKAKYKVIEKVYGNLKLDTIDFVAYDHYGIPPFSNFKTVLLYVIKVNGNFYHSKYLYSAVYKTKDNKWAGLYFPIDSNSVIQINNIAFLKKMDFEPVVIMDLSEYKLEYIKKYFPEPYFRIAGAKAEAVYGIPVEDIFNLNKSGILKARGYFK
jgi:hypothetical protein